MGDLMPVYVKTLTGATQRIWVNKRESFRTIQWPISCLGIPHSQQRHIYCGFQMEPDRTFDDYNVQKDAVIHVVARLRGASGNSSNMYIDRTKKFQTPIGVQLILLGVTNRSNGAKSLKDAWLQSINYDETRYMTEAMEKKSKKKQKDLPKDWEKQAQKKLPEAMKTLGYDQRNIDLVIKMLNPVDASVADAWLQKNRIVDKMPDLAPLFEKYPDIVSEHLLKYFTLTERIGLSTVSKAFNKMTKSPLAWKNLVLMCDWVDMTDKSFMKIMKQFGHFIERLSIQRCCYLTPNGAMLIGDYCPNLKVFFGGDCPGMTVTAIEHIFSMCLKLEVVDLRVQHPDVDFPVEKVPSVKNLKNLRELNLANRVYAENSEISSSSLKVLVINNSFTEGGYSSLKLDCPNLTHMLTSADQHKVSNSLKKTVSVNQPLRGVTVYNFTGAGCGDYFTPKVMTNDEVKKAQIYNLDLDEGTTLWLGKQE